MATTCNGKCGTLADNCGRQVNCGTTQCIAPQTCGGGDAPNVCGCKPVNACSAGQVCGTMSNGCGACPSNRPMCCFDSCQPAGSACP